MATVINNPPTTATETRSDNSGVIISIVVIALVLILLFAFGLPMIRGAYNSSSAPANGNAPQVNVPGKVDVNIKKY